MRRDNHRQHRNASARAGPLVVTISGRARSLVAYDGGIAYAVADRSPLSASALRARPDRSKAGGRLRRLLALQRFRPSLDGRRNLRVRPAAKHPPTPCIVRTLSGATFDHRARWELGPVGHPFGKRQRARLVPKRQRTRRNRPVRTSRAEREPTVEQLRTIEVEAERTYATNADLLATSIEDGSWEFRDYRDL